MKRMSIIAVGLIVILAGCQSEGSGSTAAAPAPAPPAAPTPVSTPASRMGGLELNPLEGIAGGAGRAAAPAATPSGAAVPAAAPSAPAPGTEQVKAQTGVGIKGKSLEPHSGVIVEPLKAFIRFEQKAVFDIQIPQAMQLFAATEGRKPNSHDEFMSRIIAGNNISLPKLPEGHRYVYSPEKGELMVERPAK